MGLFFEDATYLRYTFQDLTSDKKLGLEDLGITSTVYHQPNVTVGVPHTLGSLVS